MKFGLQTAFDSLPNGARSCLAFAILLTGVLVVFYWPFLVGLQSFYYGDVTVYFEPLCRFIGEAFARGKLPLWNPYTYCGMSQAAISSPGIFYPFNLLFAALPFNKALAVIMVSHQLIAGIGGFLLVASFAWGAAAAFVCGLVFALSGYMFSLQSNYTLVAAVSWLPLALWFMRYSGLHKLACCLLSVIGLAVSVFMLLASGRPEICVPSFLIVLICTFIFPDAGKSHGKWYQSPSVIAWRLLGIVIGVLLAMPEILPACEWLSLSPRAQGLVSNEALDWSANWYDLICLFVSQPLGDLTRIGNKFINLVATSRSSAPLVSSAYVGAVVASLAIWGLCDKTWKARWLFLALMLLSLSFAMGTNSALLPGLLKLFPQMAIGRYPVKFLIFPIICLAIIAARGMSFVLRGQPGRFTQLSAWLVWMSCLVGGIVLLQVRDTSIAVALANSLMSGEPLVKDACLLIGQGFVRTAAMGIATCTVAYLFWHKKIRAEHFRWSVFAGIILTTMMPAFLYMRHGTEPEFFNRPIFVQDQFKAANAAIAEQAITGRTRASHVHKSHANVWTKYPRCIMLYFDPVICPPWYYKHDRNAVTAAWHQYSRQLAMPCTNMDAHIPSAWGYESAETGDYHDLFIKAFRKSSQNFSSVIQSSDSRAQEPAQAAMVSGTDIPLARFCQMTASKFALTQTFRYERVGDLPKSVPILDKNYFELVLENRVMNVRIYKVKDSRERAYISNSWLWKDSHANVINHIVDSYLSGYNPNMITLIEPSQDSRMNYRHKAIALPAGGDNEVRLVKDLPEHVWFYVRTSVPSFFVLADQYYPGWQARVDSHIVPIYRANAVQRAVHLPPGGHFVEFDYEPESVRIGLILAMLGLVLITILLLIALISAKLSKESSRRQTGSSEGARP
jgi:hypothetical protein